MRTTFVLSALAVVVPAFGAPTVVPIIKRAGFVKPDSYIIKFTDGSSKDTAVEALTNGFTDPGSSVTYNYGEFFPGIAAKLVGSDLTAAQRLSGVEYIEQVGAVSLSYEQGIDGLPSVRQGSEASSSPLLVKRGDYGAGVTIYGLDTGIYTAHNCFEGRATWGKTFGGYPDADGHGHGTHTAGTAVGKGYGVATRANIVAVKVMSDEGSGSTDDIIAGVEYAVDDCRKGDKPCIVTMSIGGAPNKALNEAVQAAIKKNLHFTIAAGNSNVPADTSSPASVEEANTIGAVDENNNNQKASFSNYGKLIDVWAPGVNIRSAWIDGPDSTKIASGTSMATPYVAGVLAIALGKEPQLKPAELSEKLRVNAKDVVTFAAADEVAKLTSTHLLAHSW